MSDPSGPSEPTDGRLFSRRSILVDAAKLAGAAAVTGIAGTIIVRAVGGGKTQPPAGGPDTIILPFTYSTEKSAWLQQAIAAFHRGNPEHNGKRITVQPDARGSVDALQKILNGQLHPVIWSPASTLELGQLTTGWDDTHTGTQIVVTDHDLKPRSLVASPLVLLGWKSRLDLLAQQYGGLNWHALHSAFTAKNGWADISGGSDTWGQVKFGQTRPDRSNSGVLTLALLAMAIPGTSKPLNIGDVRTPDYLAFMHDFENAVTQFGQSSGTYVGCAVKNGSAAFDLITTYEHLALTELAQPSAQPLTISYPDPTLMCDHPFVVLTGASDDQIAAAKVFRDFLLSSDEQRLTLAYGFRPADTSIHLTDSAIKGNLFAKSLPGVQPSLKSSVAPAPSGDVVNALIDDWSQSFKDRPTTPSC